MIYKEVEAPRIFFDSIQRNRILGCRLHYFLYFFLDSELVDMENSVKHSALSPDTVLFQMYRQ